MLMTAIQSLNKVVCRLFRPHVMSEAPNSKGAEGYQSNTSVKPGNHLDEFALAIAMISNIPDKRVGFRAPATC